MKKIMIAHPGQQSSFRRAAALKKGGLLDQYVTTVYLKQKHKKFLGLLKLFSKGEYSRLQGRNCEVLSDTDVRQYHVIRNLFLILLNRFARLRKFYYKYNRIFSDRFSVKAAQYAIKEDCSALIMMGPSPATAFTYLRQRNSRIIKIFDMTSIAYNYQGMIMSRQREKLPDAWQSCIYVGKDDAGLAKLMENIYQADYLVVTSQFAYRSLIENRVAPEKIRIVRYGIDLPQRRVLPKKPSAAGTPLHVLYVGSVSCEKGLYYLLEAMTQFNEQEVKLTLVGKKYIPERLLEKYRQWCTFVGDIPHERVDEYYQNADLFVTPTLFDSFGRTITEAMSYGLPVICTDAAGAADYVKNGQNGFVVESGNASALVEKIRYFAKHREEISRMSEHALDCAKHHTWEEYEQTYCNTMKEIIQIEMSKKGENDDESL